MKVFENTNVLPRAFIAHRAEVPGGDAQLAARLVAPGFDPGRTALLEEPPGIALAEGGDAPLPVAARLVVAARQHLVIDTEDAQPGILVVSETHYPGWSASVDGQPAKLLRADWAFRGVALPAGHHRVEMRYRSWPTRIGIALSLCALLVAIALGLYAAPPRTRRWPKD